jgi:hypothetical protein
MDITELVWQSVQNAQSGVQVSAVAAPAKPKAPKRRKWGEPQA